MAESQKYNLVVRQPFGNPHDGGKLMGVGEVITNQEVVTKIGESHLSSFVTRVKDMDWDHKDLESKDDKTVKKLSPPEVTAGEPAK